MKLELNSLQLKIQAGKLITSEMVLLVNNIISKVVNEYDMKDASLRNTTKLSITRKLKISELYGKIDLLSKIQTQYEILKQLNEKLLKYHLKAVELKKIINNKIKVMFDQKLSNETNKDYSKFQQLATQFDFLTLDEHTFDSNKKVYDILLLSGVFGQDTLTKMNTLPKSGQPTTKQQKGR